MTKVPNSALDAWHLSPAEWNRAFGLNCVPNALQILRDCDDLGRSLGNSKPKSIERAAACGRSPYLDRARSACRSLLDIEAFLGANFDLAPRIDLLRLHARNGFYEALCSNDSARISYFLQELRLQIRNDAVSTAIKAREMAVGKQIAVHRTTVKHLLLQHQAPSVLRMNLALRSHAPAEIQFHVDHSARCARRLFDYLEMLLGNRLPALSNREGMFVRLCQHALAGWYLDCYLVFNAREISPFDAVPVIQSEWVAVTEGKGLSGLVSMGVAPAVSPVVLELYLQGLTEGILHLAEADLLLMPKDVPAHLRHRIYGSDRFYTAIAADDDDSPPWAYLTVEDAEEVPLPIEDRQQADFDDAMSLLLPP